jgi:hypothetical protein
VASGALAQAAVELWEARARRMWRKSLAVAERLKIPHEIGLAHSVLGQHAAGQDRHVLLQRAAEIFERLGRCMI